MSKKPKHEPNTKESLYERRSLSDKGPLPAEGIGGDDEIAFDGGDLIIRRKIKSDRVQ